MSYTAIVLIGLAIVLATLFIAVTVALCMQDKLGAACTLIAAVVVGGLVAAAIAGWIDLSLGSLTRI